MKKRQLKKQVSLMNDTDLLEEVVYCENKRWKTFLKKEFDKRFKETLHAEEEMAESLMFISKEADELVRNE